MNTAELEAIGLTKNQALVYLTLLKLGSAGALTIIKESGMQSSRVYDSLEKLQDIGLVSFVIKDYKKYFQAGKPEKLFDYLKEKMEAVNQIMPELKKLENTKTEEINASIYKGKEGIKTIHSEMLREGEDVYVWGAKGMIFTQLQYYIPNFEKERIKRKIKFTLIYDNKEVKRFEKEVVKRQLFEGKSMPSGFGSDTVINIFGNKTAIVLWKEPTAFMIENKSVADSFRKWFNHIYDNLN